MTGIGPQIRNMCSTLLSVRKISSFCCPSRGGIDSSSLLKMPSCFFPAVVHVMSILMEIWPEITDHKWRQSRKSLESERHQGNHQRAWLNEQQVTSSSINKNNVYINSCSSEHHVGTFPFSIIFEITFWVFLGIGVFSPTFSRTWHILGKLGFGQSMASTNAGAATGREENSNLGCFFFFFRGGPTWTIPRRREKNWRRRKRQLHLVPFSIYQMRHRMANRRWHVCPKGVSQKKKAHESGVLQTQRICVL